MGAPVPCMDHPSITDAVMELIAEGRPGGEIVARVNGALGRALDDRRVRRLVYDLRAYGRDRWKPRPEVRFTLDGGDLQLLRDAARRRGIAAGALARRLITVAVRDGIIDAILDDDERAAA